MNKHFAASSSQFFSR